MDKAILTLNSGSSSVKFAVFSGEIEENETPWAVGQMDGLGGGARQPTRFVVKNAAGETVLDETEAPTAGVTHAQALQRLLNWLRGQPESIRLQCVGHRVVHGGQAFSAPVRLTPEVLVELDALTSLAPLHQPHNLAGIRAVATAMPELAQVACFDTAFHRSQPERAQTFALPRALTATGIRRYGFHGLSYEYIAWSLPRHVDEALARGRVIVAHLGNGASMCAMRDLRSVATTMGFTALDGLVMGSRPGNLDPGVLLHLMEQHGMDAAALARLLYKESGLLGVSGISQDMRVLLASDEPAAREAVELFCYRAVREIGSLAAALGGLDLLVFTGGIGEHASSIRESICRELTWLDLSIDAASNVATATTGRGAPRWISTQASRTKALALATNEEWIIARHARALAA